MKNLFSVFGGVLALLLVGCGSEEPPKDDSSMRQAMDGKNFDPNKMPPQARAIIEGMKKNGHNAAVSQK